MSATRVYQKYLHVCAMCKCMTEKMTAINMDFIANANLY